LDPISAIVGAFAAGALTSVQGLASDAVKTAYDELKNLIARRLPRNSSITDIEQAPTSVSAREALAGALEDVGADKDIDVRFLAEKLAEALEQMGSAKLRSADVEIGVIKGYRNAIAADIEATGKISIHKMIADTGDAVVSGLKAGVPPKKKV
jgi:hypothetical protein